MVFKRTASLLLTAVVLGAGVLPACAASTEPITVTNETRTVVVNVETIQYEGTEVPIAVWYPNYSRNDFGKHELGEINALSDVVTVNADKHICKTFTLKADAPSGRYTVDLHIPGESAPQSYNFDYRDLVAAAKVLETAQEKSADDIREILDTSINDISVKAGVSYLNYSDEQRRHVATNIEANRPADEAALEAQLLEEVRILDTIDTLAAKATDRAELKKMLEAEPSLYGLTDENMTSYNALSDEQLEKFYTNFSAGVPSCVFPNDVAAAFGTALTAATKTTGSSSSGSATTGGGGGGGGGGKVTSLRTDNSIVTVSDDETAPDDSFSDIKGHWAANPIHILTEKGILSGKSETEFCPNDTIKREEFVKMLVLAFECKSPSAVALPFDDVEYGAWYYTYLETAYSLGIVKGVSADCFGLGTEISRQDMAVLIYNACIDAAMSFGSEEKTFADHDSIAGYAQKAVAVLGGNGIINGRDDGSFNPTATATRAEAVKMLYEAMYRFNLL